MTYAEAERRRVLCGSRYDTVLVLGGSASHLAPEEIEQLRSRAKRDVLLMHYAPDTPQKDVDLDSHLAGDSLHAATASATSQIRIGRYIASILPAGCESRCRAHRLSRLGPIREQPVTTNWTAKGDRWMRSWNPRPWVTSLVRSHVPAYQRGYRWGADEVDRLLSDIWASEGKPYYLQPIVVKAMRMAGLELIDGQQRLTTLYLIFNFMQTDGLESAGAGYTMEYETREGSQAYPLGSKC